MNRLTLVGRPIRDPEPRALLSGTTVCDMRLAVDGPRDDDTVFSTRRRSAPAPRRAPATCARAARSASTAAWPNEWTAADGAARSKHSAIGH